MCDSQAKHQNAEHAKQHTRGCYKQHILHTPFRVIFFFQFSSVSLSLSLFALVACYGFVRRVTKNGCFCASFNRRGENCWSLPRLGCSLLAFLELWIVDIAIPFLGSRASNAQISVFSASTFGNCQRFWGVEGCLAMANKSQFDRAILFVSALREPDQSIHPSFNQQSNTKRELHATELCLPNAANA